MTRRPRWQRDVDRQPHPARDSPDGRAMLVFPYAEQGTRARGQGPNQARGNATMGIRARYPQRARRRRHLVAAGLSRSTAAAATSATSCSWIPNRRASTRSSAHSSRSTPLVPQPLAVGAAATPDVTVLIYRSRGTGRRRRRSRASCLATHVQSEFLRRGVERREAIAQADGPEPVAAWRQRSRDTCADRRATAPAAPGTRRRCTSARRTLPIESTTARRASPIARSTCRRSSSAR